MFRGRSGNFEVRDRDTNDFIDLTTGPSLLGRFHLLYLSPHVNYSLSPVPIL